MSQLSIKTRIFSIIPVLISLIAAAILFIEQTRLNNNPDYVPSCSWNPLFSCQGPMSSWQSHTFIIPNPILGMIGYGILLLVLAVSLLSKIRLPKFVYYGYTTGVIASSVYLAWLQTQSIYDIKALCSYCMIIWVVNIPLLWVTVRGTLVGNNKISPRSTKWVRNLTPVIITTHYLVLGLMIYVQFFDFFQFLMRG